MKVAFSNPLSPPLIAIVSGAILLISICEKLVDVGDADYKDRRKKGYR